MLPVSLILFSLIIADSISSDAKELMLRFMLRLRDARRSRVAWQTAEENNIVHEQVTTGYNNNCWDEKLNKHVL